MSIRAAGERSARYGAAAAPAPYQPPRAAKFARRRDLGSPQYCDHAAQGLSSSGLGRRDSLADPPDRKLTYALINALVSYRRIDVPHEEYWTYRRLFVYPGGGWEGRQHGSGRQVFTPAYQPVRHASVHKTLVEYTGQDYGYDQRAWKNWRRSVQSEMGRR